MALESALERLRAAKKQVVLAGPLPEPRRVFDRANLPKHHDHVHFHLKTLAQGARPREELVAARDVETPYSVPLAS